MNAPTEFQTILGADGKPEFVVIPYAAFVQRYGAESDLIPNEVAGAVLKGGVSITRAWREHLGLTQADVAARAGISQAALAQIEAAKRPRKATVEKLATALGITQAQLSIN